MIKPIVLIILDGWGLAPEGPGNAVSLAKIPNFSSYWNSFPHTQLQASGETVGLPHGEKGNSETGHLNLGAGRIVYQDLPRINMAVADGSFFKIPAFLKAVEHVKKNNSNFHLIGLIGQGGVHSSMEHLFALLRLTKEQNLSNCFLHLFTDGRDSPPTSASSFLSQVEIKIKEIGLGQIATLVGRFYAMDRDNHWERTEIAYRALTERKGSLTQDFKKAISDSYAKNETDEFLKPIIIDKTPRIKAGDAVIFFNFRIDRPRQLTKAFVISDFENLVGQKIAFDPYTEKYYKKTYVEERIASIFKRGPKIENLFFVTMTEYEKGLPAEVAFPPTVVNLPLGRILSGKGVRQLKITETEKERFITYYFNGQQEQPFSEEERIIIPSVNVPTYDLKPEMSAFEITDTLIKRLLTRTYDFILVNFANPDMVGHTGNLQAGISACEAVDTCLGKIVSTVKNIGGVSLITADHGNIEEMINLETGEVDTEHSKNPVPFIVVGKEFLGKPEFLPSGILADVAPTVLSFFKFPIPSQMSGRPLI
ncbi:2,3-bisphosphoglycerate-independent phosphoglycerate mutase [Candidatus Shapirobacteria bacterium CG10_big_fil_rev_8_21_14_0_10_40_9]|uniref:2,3-bisphosphoglycerate-independent phosphoglycerate mutase n=1 Tax=Candidatus Shapirobacteria bacterium CG10_big_fil_rev_8_21_14_0_10_40_9 TaxID=1974888 RepID=A0A2M8L3Z0_9BACT|nr:MAG: 2,3-bisphosphoglycerate-independent phosphoglycerate mutase [Candidatus Shapirobacteria bacterium CG10_big_fil_rev_8_21_14_0_10_40_9]